MAVKYLFKCNPLVAKAAGVGEFSRYRWPDGCILLWENDLIAIDRERYFLDNAGFLADLGVARMTDPECAADQREPRVRLPEARLPEYRWEQPSATAEGADAGRTEECADNSGDAEGTHGAVGNRPSMAAQSGDARAAQETLDGEGGEA